MPLLTWTPEFSVDIPEIDQQHRKLIDLINQFYDAMRQGKAREALGPVLAELVQYTGYHFSAEEQLLRQLGYPDYASHKDLHDALRVKTETLQENFRLGNDNMNIEVMLFLSNWLNVHILEVDKKYAAFIAQKRS